MKHYNGRVSNNYAINRISLFLKTAVATVLILASLGAVSFAYGEYTQAEAERQHAIELAEFEARRAESIRQFNDTMEHEAQKRQWAMVRENLDILEEARIAAEEEAAAAEAAYWDSYYYYEEPYYLDYDISDGITAEEFQWYGVIEQDGVKYTWYSQNVLPGGGLTELNSNGRHVEGGFVMDGDGYIAVASSDYEKGTVVDTPFGPGKVYDSGCEPGKIDVYTNF